MVTAATENKETERIYFIDLLRIIACFFVIVNHTNSDVFKGSMPSFTWFASLSYFFCSKAAVPVFLMISGYTMLNQQDTNGKAFFRVFRYGCSLVFFSGIYFLFQYLAGEWPLSVTFFLRRLVNGQITNAFWYMYLYLGILLMIPFLQKFVSVLKAKDFLILFFWSMLLRSVLPIMVHYIPETQISEHFVLPLFDSYTMLLLLGYYFRKYCKPSKYWRLPCTVGYIASVILNVVLTYHEYIRNDGVDYLFFDNRVFIPILLGGFCLFALVSTVHLKETMQKIVIVVGKLTFGIYLFSDLIIDKLEFVYPQMIQHGIPVMPAMVIYEVVVFVTCAAITYILKKIPVLQKLL